MTLGSVIVLGLAFALIAAVFLDPPRLKTTRGFLLLLALVAIILTVLD